VEKQNQLTPEEKWEKATIANNFIFYKVMRNNPDICKEFLERLLQFQINKIIISQEEEIFTDIDSKSIRMDVYAKNETEVFNLEMQSVDTKDLPERARYYQGIMDVDNLRTGEEYYKLKTSYIIFICKNDIFNQEQPVYIFQNLCKSNPSLSLNDRTFKYFFIAKNYDKIEDEKQKTILKLVMENISTDSFSEQILELVNSAKKNTEWRRSFMEYERQRAYDIDQGKHDKAVEVAEKSLKMNLPINQIIELTGLSIEEIEKIKNQNN